MYNVGYIVQPACGVSSSSKQRIILSSSLSEFRKALYLPSLLVSLSVVDLSRAPSEDGVPAAEEAMEATEEDQESPGQDTSQPGIYTEHVFTDPLGTESSGASASNDNQR